MSWMTTSINIPFRKHLGRTQCKHATWVLNAVATLTGALPRLHMPTNCHHEAQRQTTIAANYSAIDPDFSSSGVLSAVADAATALPVTCTNGTTNDIGLALTPPQSNARLSRMRVPLRFGVHFGVAAVLDRCSLSYDVFCLAPAQARPPDGHPHRYHNRTLTW